MATQVYIERYSLAAAALLRHHTPWVGRVHSCYDRILNILAPSGQILTLQGPGLLQAPCAASLSEAIEACVATCVPGDLVGDHPSATLTLHTASATVWDGRLHPIDMITASTLRNVSTQLAAWLAEHANQHGIVPVLAALDMPNLPVLSPLHRRVYDALMPMLRLRRISTASIEHMASQLIGLGEGLTPSGDDLLVGLLAVLHITGQNALIPSLPAWVAPFLTNTPDLSGAFLRCALEGHFAEPLAQFVRALYNVNSLDWSSHADHLARVGHSSGVDAMVGIAVASRLLAATGLSQVS